MADDIRLVALTWRSATYFMLADAEDNGGAGMLGEIKIPNSIGDKTKKLVRWCDASNRPIDPSPFTDCVMFAEQTERHRKAEDLKGMFEAYKKCTEAFRKCNVLVDRISDATERTTLRGEGDGLGVAFEGQHYLPAEIANRLNCHADNVARYAKSAGVQDRPKKRGDRYNHDGLLGLLSKAAESSDSGISANAKAWLRELKPDSKPTTR